VCAAIGAGYPTACIVDIGFSKTNIACVDDGDVISGTVFHFHYGGFDISRFFLYLLQHHQRCHSFHVSIGTFTFLFLL
jgi:actin-related protein 8